MQVFLNFISFSEFNFLCIPKLKIRFLKVRNTFLFPAGLGELTGSAYTYTDRDPSMSASQLKKPNIRIMVK